MITSQIGQVVIAQDRRWVNAFVEFSVITLFAIGVGWLNNPADPLMIKEDFHWIWYAPVLVALRYGTLWGILSVATLGLNTYLAITWFDQPVDVELSFIIGGLILTLLVGEFADVWYESHHRKDEANLYLEERLTRLTRQYLLLKISHDLLEEQMLARPGSLRSAIQALRQQILTSQQGITNQSNVSSLLTILAQYNSIEQAQIYEVEWNKQSETYQLGSVVAQLGNPASHDINHPMLQQALERGSLVHLGMDELENTKEILLATPLMSSHGQIWGLFVVESMPFYAYNEGNLHFIQVLVFYFADLLQEYHFYDQHQQGLLDVLDSDFIEELNRLVRVAKTTQVYSYLVVFKFSGNKKDILPEQMQQLKRGLDMTIRVTIDNDPSLIMLLPFASISSVKGMIVRLNNWLIERHQGSFDDYKIDVHQIKVDREKVFKELKDIVLNEQG